jgi:hypothetical protein
VTNEVAGTGYTAGGAPVVLTVTREDANNRVKIDVGAVTWANASLTARACVVYKARGGAASADELIFYGDFLADKTASGGDFTANATSFFINKT